MRSSWLIVVRNSDLALFADWASRVCRSSAARAAPISEAIVLKLVASRRTSTSPVSGTRTP